MVKIRQHGSAGELFDVNTFVSDIDSFFAVDTWVVGVKECLGDGAQALRESALRPTHFSDSEFRGVYQSIYQTIDGRFTALRHGLEQCRLVAVDSSWWEVSGTPDFEAHMLRKYGAFEL